MLLQALRGLERFELTADEDAATIDFPGSRRAQDDLPQIVRPERADEEVDRTGHEGLDGTLLIVRVEDRDDRGVLAPG